MNNIFKKFLSKISFSKFQNRGIEFGFNIEYKFFHLDGKQMCKIFIIKLNLFKRSFGVSFRTNNYNQILVISEKK